MHSMLAPSGHITLPKQLGGSPCIDKLATSKASCRPFVKATNRSACRCAQRASDSQNAPSTEAFQLDRRALLLALAAAPSLTQLQPAQAEAPKLTSFKDKADEFSLSVPADWVTGEGTASGATASGVRRALAWYPEGDLDTNLTIVITNVGADFTRLGSFGDAEQFGGQLVAQMDRSYLNRSWNKPKQPPQEAKLLQAKSQNNMYFIEYTVTKPAQEQKHLMSAVALGFNGRYNRLYTVTGQCKESQLPQYQKMLQSALQTFSPPPLPAY